MNYATALFISALLFIPASASADCITDRFGKTKCGNGQCDMDVYGKVFCADAGGGAMRDSFGKVHCGAGSCARDYAGRVWCSRQPGGGAAADSYGKVKCLEGCEAGSPEKCREGQ